MMIESSLRILEHVALTFEVQPREMGLEGYPVIDSRVSLLRQRNAEEREYRRAPGNLAAMIQRIEDKAGQ